MKTLLLAFFLAPIFIVSAQNVPPPNLFELYTEFKEVNMSELDLSDPDSLGIDTIEKIKVVLKLPNNINIKKVHLEIGSSQNQTDIFNGVINLDGTNNPSTIELSTGEITYILITHTISNRNLWGKVKLEDDSNNLSNYSIKSLNAGF